MDRSALPSFKERITVAGDIPIDRRAAGTAAAVKSGIIGKVVIAVPQSRRLRCSE